MEGLMGRLGSCKETVNEGWDIADWRTDGL